MASRYFVLLQATLVTICRYVCCLNFAKPLKVLKLCLQHYIANSIIIVQSEILKFTNKKYIKTIKHHEGIQMCYCKW